MIFDDDIVETGSFNYTKAAQNYNAENTVFIKNPAIANLFTHNFIERERVSKFIKNDSCESRHYY